MNKINIKRVISIVGVLALFAVALVVYKENTTYDFTDGVSFFKKYYKPHENTVHRYMEKFNYECAHSKIVELEKELDQPKQAFDETLIGLDDVSKALPIESAFNPIRITIDYSNIASLPAAQSKFIKTNIVPAVMNYLTELIKVQRLTSPIKVDPAYKGKPCGQAKIVIPDDHFTKGVANTDLIYYVQAYRSNENTLAYASYCPQGQNYGLASGRPTVAYMNINLGHLDKDVQSKDPMDIAKWIFISMHEVIHSLVFSPNYFDMFLAEKKPVQIIDGKSYVTAPSVVKLAKEHFGCPTLTKVPLEDEGGSGTQGAHWERKAFGNEMMTGSQLYDSVLSKFTAAMFKASGWYQVVDYMVGTLTWGNQDKCEFVEYPCPKSSKEFCSGAGKKCSYDYTGPGVCSGSDFLADKCSYWSAWSNQHCNFPDENTKKVYSTSGGSFGPKARCFDTDLADKVGWVDVKSLCLESRCDFSSAGTQVIFKVSGKEYACTTSTKSVVIPGKGTVQCPDVLRFCFSPSACPYSCSGKGICRLGKCACYKGFTGEDCSVPK